MAVKGTILEAFAPCGMTSTGGLHAEPNGKY